MNKNGGTLTPKKRALQKALSRQRDKERLAQGEISAVELQRENLHFRDLPNDRIMFTRCKKTGRRLYLAMPPDPNDRNTDEN